MRYRKRPSYKDIRRKNIIKIIRTIFEVIFCVAVIAVIINIVFFPDVYKEPDKAKWSQTYGFTALSYTGVTRKNEGSLITKDRLDSHLKALFDSGYVTIGIQDIIEFYKDGKPLPEKALFLIFEDGRRDSFIFAQPLLEKYNFKAVMFTYASNVQEGDRLFLKKKDLNYLEKSSYWENGSNGYRFAHINEYRKETINPGDNEKDSEMEFNHYLMDYLRDEDGIPVESRKQMEQRIIWDYEEMNKIYIDALGYQPEIYMIMHANSLFKNINPAVEEINLKNIYKYFKVMFNREGLSYNNKEDSIYNLTRMRVEPDWTADRLLEEMGKEMQGR